MADNGCMATAALDLDIKKLHEWAVMAGYGRAVMGVTVVTTFAWDSSVFSFGHKTLHNQAVIMITTVIGRGTKVFDFFILHRRVHE